MSEEDHTLEAAATRELWEETGLVLPPVLRLRQLHSFGDVGRDPRPGRWVSVAFYAPIIHSPRWREIAGIVRAGDDAATVRWFPVSDLPQLAFDHAAIVAHAFEPEYLHVDRRSGWPSHQRGY